MAFYQIQIEKIAIIIFLIMLQLHHLNPLYYSILEMFQRINGLIQKDFIKLKIKRYFCLYYKIINTSAYYF